MTVKGSKGPPRQRERWNFKCNCGNEVEITKSSVTSGVSRSCGCLLVETTIQANTERATHGHTRGKKPSSEVSWQSMRARYGNPNNEHYKGHGCRGITVCERWESFENFLADMGPRPSPRHQIDRID